MNLIVLEQVESTNTMLKEMLKKGADFGTVVYSENQTAGQGRRGKYWHSKAGKNISVSLSLRAFREDGLMSLAAGVAVVEAIKDLWGEGLDIGIKWPNDVMIGGKKLCGISCEKIGEHIVLGVGVNVNNIGFPKELTQLATSLYLETGKKWDLLQLRDEIVSRIFAPIPKDILSKVRTLCINLGQNVRILGENGAVDEGMAVDIDTDGSIIIQQNTCRKNFYSGEISLRMGE